MTTVSRIEVFPNDTPSASVDCTVFSDEPDDFVLSVKEGPAQGKLYGHTYKRLWYPSSRVQTRLKPSDFSGEKILSMPSFGGEVKPSVPCRRLAACKRSLHLPWKSHVVGKIG